MLLDPDPPDDEPDDPELEPDEGDDEEDEEEEEPPEELDELSLLEDEELELLSVGVERLSVLYQPEPLNTIPGGCSTRFVSPPHLGHTLIGSSLKLCFTSKRLRQAEHS